MTPDIMDVILKKLEDMDSRIVNLIERVSRVEVKVDNLSSDDVREQEDKKERPARNFALVASALTIALTALNLILFLVEHLH